jgi:hypothetical protein
MFKKYLIVISLFLVLLSGYIGLSYFSSSTYSDYELTLVRKYEQNKEYRGIFYDPINNSKTDLKMDKILWESIKTDKIYRITYEFNELFKDPKIIELEEK